MIPDVEIEESEPNKMKFDTGEILGHQKGDQECKLDIFGQNFY